MNIGTGLIYASLILAVATFVLSIIHLILNRARNERLAEDFFFFARLGSGLLFTVVSMALVLLYIYFLTSEMSIQYVWEYSAKAHPTEYKISGVLAGKAGSLLFWIWCMVFSWFVEEIRDLRKPRGTVVMGLTRTIIMMISTIFLYFLNSRELFKETPATWLAASPDGNGLNPLLQTPLMVIHPPIVFIAYGFMVMGMAAGFAYLICKDKKWVSISIPWSRWGFLFLTLGIGIGGLWAYVVLDWGGYWAWDPVETSSFLPWMLLTAFLHAQLMFKRKGHYKFAAPALGIYSFVLVIFATFITRAGGIWHSVHAFGQADVAVSPWDRFIDVVTSDSIIMGYFVLMIGITILGAVLLVWALIRWSTPDEEYASDRLPKGLMEELINDKNLMFFTLIVISLSTIVTLLLLILSINGADRTQFDTKVGFFAIIGIVVLTFCMVWRYLGRRITAYLVLFTGAVSFVLAIVFPDDMIVALTLPSLVLAAGACGIRIAKSVNPKSLKGSLNGIAPHLIHLGVAFVLIGYVASQSIDTEKTEVVDVGDSIEIGPYEIKIINIEVEEDTGNEEFDEFWDTWTVFFEVYNNGELVERNEANIIYQWRIDYGSGIPQKIYSGIVQSKIYVGNMIFEDLYVIFNPLGDGVTVKVLPLMNVLWLGMWLMAAGIFMRLMVALSRPKKKVESGRARRRESLRTERDEAEEDEEMDDEQDLEADEGGDLSEPGKKERDYYEDLIERELEDMD